MKILIVASLALTLASASNSYSTDSEIAPSGRIFKGKNVKFLQFPYIVGLSTTHSNSKRTWCSGSIINKEWILTAAHCLQDVVKVDVLVGAEIRSLPNLTQTVTAKETIVHEKFISNKRGNDIGLIKIKPLVCTKCFSAIKLPGKEANDYVGKKAFVAGWGYTDVSKTIPVSILQWGLMTVISNRECGEAYHDDVSSIEICTMPIDGVSTCNGDSGGPLVLESNPNVIIGVAAVMAKPGCDKGYPAMFTNVQSHLDWIHKKIK